MSTLVTISVVEAHTALIPVLECIDGREQENWCLDDRTKQDNVRRKVKAHRGTLIMEAGFRQQQWMVMRQLRKGLLGRSSGKRPEEDYLTRNIASCEILI